MARWGYMMERWGVDSISPHPVPVWSDRELREAIREFNRVKKRYEKFRPNRPTALMLQLFTPPHKKNKTKDQKAWTFAGKVAGDPRLYGQRYPDLQGKRVYGKDDKGYFWLKKTTKTILHPSGGVTETVTTWERVSIGNGSIPAAPKGINNEKQQKQWDRRLQWQWKYNRNGYWQEWASLADTRKEFNQSHLDAYNQDMRRWRNEYREMEQEYKKRIKDIRFKLFG